MDLISRERLINKLDPWYKKIKKTAPDNLAEGFMQVDGLIRHEPSAFEGMTNGEVIQAVFNVMVLTVKDGKVWVERIFFPFDEIWWNAPYKAESEEV